MEKNEPINKKWYAVYTRPKHEKKINTLFLEKGIESFLPIQKELRQWKDRKKWIEKVMFNSYIFVKIYEHEFFEVLKHQGVVKFISINKKPCQIPDQQIELIKNLINNKYEIITETYNFNIGDNVEIINGVLNGVKGKLLDYKGKKKFVLTVEILKSCLLIEIDGLNLKLINT